jgi:TolB-like protein/Flp pilus assembly protein TadD
MSILKKLATYTPPPVSQIRAELPTQLSELIARLLAKDRAERPASARAVAGEVAAIERALVNAAPGAKTATAPTKAAAPLALPPSDVTRSIPPPGQQSATLHGPPSGPSIAVLPFVNMSSDPENEFFSDGLAEELIAVLTKVKGLHVTSRTSAFAFKGKREDVRQIGAQLNVRTVLEGSVRKSGQRLRISAQLVKVADGYELWSETYNRQMADVFDIQDEIAQSIAAALHVILTEEDAPNAAAPASVEAYEFYLRGRQFFHQFRRRSFEFAEEMFARAIEIDPGYARAYAGIADCRSSLYLNWAATEDNLRRADAASCKALELGPDLAEAHVARGLVLSLRKQFAEARGEFETAIRLDATLFEARYLFARHCRREGKLLEAAELLEQAWHMRQDDYQSICLLASIYHGLGRMAEAQATGRRCIGVIEKHLALHPDSARALYLGAIVWMQLNEPARATAWAERALAMDPDEPLTLYNVACFYALQKKTDQALDVLERAVRQGFADQETMVHDADFDSLRGHPRFQALVDRLAK